MASLSRRSLPSGKIPPVQSSILHQRSPIIMIITALLFVVLALLASGQGTKNVSKVVDLGYSKYEGVHGDKGVTHWYGIRYGAAPLGDLRFRAPQDPPATGHRVLPADNKAPGCRNSPSTTFDPSRSEDCLFLDVYTPTTKKENLPVYVFIQGGGLNIASENLNGTNLVVAADHEMIVVDFNYRVGPYGFLASKEVKANGNLNNGQRDQRKVLQWVQRHISKFGGDPRKVTIGGASAGAGSVGIQMLAFGGRNDHLFAAVHAESPSFGFARTIEESQFQYDALVERVNCSSSKDTLKCLRDLPAETIPENNPDLNTPGGGGGKALYMWSNVIDDDLIRDQPYRQFSNGNFVKVPAIYGGDTNEGTVFTPSNISNYTEMNNFLRNNWPKITSSQLSTIDSLYPKAEQFPNRGAYFRTAANAYGDLRYTCPNINLAALFTSRGVLNSYNYRWDVVNSAEDAATGLGVTHTAGINPIFGLSAAGTPAAVISPYIQAYMVSFIRTVGDPNTYRKKGSPKWERFDGNEMRRMHFPNDPSKVGMERVTPDQTKQCAYFSSIAVSIGQ